MANSSIHVTRVHEIAAPVARITPDGAAFITVRSGDAEVSFSDPSPDALIAFLYAMSRSVVRASAAVSAWPEAGRAAPMLPEPLMESVPSYYGDPDVRPFRAEHRARRAMSSEDAQDAPSGPDGLPDVPVAATREAAS